MASNDLQHAMSESESDIFSMLRDTTYWEMVVKSMYHLQNIFTINCLIVTGKDGIFVAGRLCDEWEALKKWLEASNAYKVKVIGRENNLKDDL